MCVYEKMSSVSQRILGTWIEDEQPGSSVARWMQQQLRGHDFSLARRVEAFAAQQPERPDPRRVVVMQVKPDAVECRLPCAVLDHESPHPFRYEVFFSLDPWTGAITPLAR